jgi:ADP-heptose:LPS heptosyltransferase
VLAAAARMRALDLVVSVDSMPAQLAGALGVPVRLLLATEADWRWMEGRADSPWYPAMRLLRQERPGDWTAPLATLAAELRSLAQAKGAPRPSL